MWIYGLENFKIVINSKKLLEPFELDFYLIDFLWKCAFCIMNEQLNQSSKQKAYWKIQVAFFKHERERDLFACK